MSSFTTCIPIFKFESCLPGLKSKAEEESFNGILQKIGSFGEPKCSIGYIIVGLIHLQIIRFHY